MERQTEYYTKVAWWIILLTVIALLLLLSVMVVLLWMVNKICCRFTFKTAKFSFPILHSAVVYYSKYYAFPVLTSVDVSTGLLGIRSHKLKILSQKLFPLKAGLLKKFSLIEAEMITYYQKCYNMKKVVPYFMRKVQIDKKKC